jgi:hypothetical protein
MSDLKIELDMEKNIFLLKNHIIKQKPQVPIFIIP